MVALALLLVVLIAISSVTVLVALTSGTAKTKSASQQTSSTVSSTISSGGLRLGLSVISGETGSGRTIVVSLSDFNVLDSVNSPAIVGMPTIGGTPLSLGPCNQLPLGFALAEGNYQANNLSEALPLLMFQPAVYSCPVEFAVSYFSFAMFSDNVTLYSAQPTESGNTPTTTPMWTQPDVFNQTFSGYWTGAVESGTFHAFPSGVYTLIGADDFGQITTVHFYVSASTGTTTSTTGQSSTSASTTTTPQGGQSASANSQYGLKLVVNMNATEIVPGQSVEINLTEFNTLASVNNVSASGDWAVPVALGPCENEFSQPFGIAVYAGHIDPQNVSQGQQVDIFPVVACPMYIRLVTGYEFQPQSNLALTLPESGAIPSPLVGSVVVSMSYSPQVQPLAPGAYTVVAADEWGALVFLYFEVS